MLIDIEDIDRIAATRRLFADTGEAVATQFYIRLFELAPDLRQMFPADMTEQNRKRSATLAVAVSSLRDWNDLAPILAALARRHVAYGVRSWHYAIVTQALLDTLRGGGVEAATVEAWNRAMSVICAHMIAAAYGVDGVPTEAPAAPVARAR